jgi:hypothetical protein
MVGRVFVWPGFTSTSTDPEMVITRFTTADDGILFEIELHAGDVAVSIEDYSQCHDEHEVLIAPRSGFRVRSVEFLDLPSGDPSAPVRMPLVKLAYARHWRDFETEKLRPHVLPQLSDVPFWLSVP